MPQKLKLIKEIESCVTCRGLLPHEPRPVVNFSTASKIIIIGQAPGLKVHQSGIPWDDASGKQLRNWLDVTTEQFYKPKNFAIIPMGFCYPGKGKTGGDAPPRKECASKWHSQIFSQFNNAEGEWI